MNITCVEPLGISEEQFRKTQSAFAAEGHNFNYFMDRREDEATLAERMKDSEIAIISNIKRGSAVLAQCPKLKMLSVAFTGLDHIDLNYCKEHNIFVQNAAGYSTTAVSELAVGLMIDVLRKVPELDGTIRQGGSRGSFLGRELKGKAVGVVGTGAIGTATIKLLKAFGCKVMAYSRSQRKEVVDMGVEYCDLDTLMRQSDIVTLHVPMTAETHHLVGANLTVRHKQLEVQVTAAENIWSDSIRPYHNAAYNAHYFRGRQQAVVGASARYNHGWFDAFAEVATSQNQQWGVGVLAGSRFYPTEGVSLIALYRYYSPWFDNALGYGFSETSRINDENGGYVGFDITRLQNWRFSGYGDVFYFSGVKYGIPEAGTIGYDVLFETEFQKTVRGDRLAVSGRLRARKKGYVSTYSGRMQFDWERGPWSLRTTADANYVNSYGVSVAQDVAYNFQRVPLSLRGRLQFFDAREWANRIYLYEHDVLYSFSIPASYGLGGRGYVCLKWQIIDQLALYFRVSETIYEKGWATSHKRSITRTDLHILLRTKL